MIHIIFFRSLHQFIPQVSNSRHGCCCCFVVVFCMTFHCLITFGYCPALSCFTVNSSYNVGIPQKRRIQEELIRACYVLGDDDTQWRNLFEPSTDFFERHANYLQITISAKAGQDFVEWKGLCQSRLRILINALESPEVTAWPFANFFEEEKKKDDDDMMSTIFFIGLRFANGVESINLKQYSSDFLYNHINSWEGRKPGMDFLMAVKTQPNLPFDLIEKHLGEATTSNHHRRTRTSHHGDAYQQCYRFRKGRCSRGG